MFNRAGVFYSEDTTTGKQHSLRTKDEAEALAILHSKNEAHRQPVLNLQIARTYLTATDPEVARRTWQTAMDELTKTKGDTLRRAAKNADALDLKPEAKAWLLDQFGQDRPISNQPVRACKSAYFTGSPENASFP